MAFPAITVTRNDGLNTEVTEDFEPINGGNRVVATEASPVLHSVDGNIFVQLPGQRPSGKVSNDTP
jgi:hypothetical protein